VLQQAAAIAFSPDCRELLTFDSDGAYRLWDTVNWRVNGTLGRGVYLSAEFSPDGHEIWTFSEGKKTIWTKRFPDHPGGHFSRPEVWLAIVTGLAWLINLFRSRPQFKKPLTTNNAL
jgi:hypothetical protein